MTADDSSDTAAQTAIDLANLKFRWNRRGPLVLDIERFSVVRGERVFIKGASGTGKSTLLSVLGGVAQPESGQVRVLGTDIGALRAARRDAWRADHVGFVFQMFNLIPYLSVLDNVVLPCRYSHVRRQRAIQGGADLEHEARRLLAHLGLEGEDILRRRVTELSVGQQQRVAAARALIGAPEIVIADEPTSALDADRREAFLRLLLNECRSENITLVFVSHDTTLQPLFDRAVALNDINRATCAAA